MVREGPGGDGEVKMTKPKRPSVSITVPEAVTGRLIDTVTDWFAPFTEAKRLRGDQIRLQREDVLIKIARKAKSRELIEKFDPEKVELKFIVPFLEQASLENIDSDLVDWWASLLNSARKNLNFSQPIFVDFMSKITSAEAKFIIYLKSESSSDKDLNYLGVLDVFMSTVSTPSTNYALNFARNQGPFDGRNNAEFDSFVKACLSDLSKVLATNSVFLMNVEIHELRLYGKYWQDATIDGTNVSEESAIEKLILIGVLKEMNYDFNLLIDCIPNHPVQLRTIQFTELGRQFVRACMPNNEVKDGITDG
jgi:hypothetical protein